MQPIADAQRTIDGVERDVHVIELPGHGETPLEHDEDFALVPLGTKLAWTPDGAAREVRRLNAAKLREKVPHFAAVLEARHAKAGSWECALVRTAALHSSIGDAPILADDALRRVHCPTVIAAGTKDDTVPAEETLNAARATGGQSVMLEGVAHLIESVPVAQVVALMRRLIVAVA